MKKYFLILSLLFIISCKKADAPAYEGFTFYFDSPQPVNDSELSNIPRKFRGIFMNSDSVYINVQENVILREYYNKFRFHKSDLDSLKQGFDFKNGKFVSKLSNEVYDYKYIKDSVEFSNKQIDTFFVFSDTQKAKRFNGQLVLSYKDSIYWTVKPIHLENNILKIKYIYSKEDLKRLDSLTKVKSTKIDSSFYIIRPSRSEFKRILNLKRLGEEQHYVKIIK